jgi:hypothetical protein
MRDFVEWLSSTALSQSIQNAVWLIALMQIVHIACVAIILSSVAVGGLRAVRAGAKGSLRDAMAPFLPRIWWSLLALFVSGLVQIVAEPARTLVDNPSFEIKMALLAVAIASLLGFGARAQAKDAPARSAPGVGLLAAGTFLLWSAIAIAGRWIAYTQSL